TPTHPMILKPGKVLDEGRYTLTIENLLGANSQGFTYRATARTKDARPRTRDVVLREFFMTYCSERGEDGLSVLTSEEIAPTVAKCREQFSEASKERRRISEHNPTLINVLDTFEANNTSYYVVEWLEGPTLEEYVEEHGPLTLDETRSILGPIFRAAAHMHASHALHTDIYPGHIRFTKHGGENRPVLFSLYPTMHFDDEGNPRWLLQNTRCRTGYAPPEQYREISHFLPQADVYALAATTVFCLTGKHLPDSRQLSDDELRDYLPPTLPETYSVALLHALSHDFTDRTESVTGVFDDMKLTYGVNQRALRTETQSEVKEEDETEARSIFSRHRLWVMLVAALVALIALGFAIMIGMNDDPLRDTEIFLNPRGTIAPSRSSCPNTTNN
ncbi:MAG: hypothetical protein K2H87_07625, partial [Duncaniella sp.]|nr:hypothetical protein [Duncaniella sp.]